MLEGIPRVCNISIPKQDIMKINRLEFTAQIMIAFTSSDKNEFVCSVPEYVLQNDPWNSFKSV
jgi:hypothetical protein